MLNEDKNATDTMDKSSLTRTAKKFLQKSRWSERRRGRKKVIRSSGNKSILDSSNGIHFISMI